MKIKKFISKRKFILSALLLALLTCVFSVYGIIGSKTAKALNAVPSSTTVTDPLYDFDKYCYSESALDDLASQVLGRGNNLNSLITYAKNTAGTTGEPIDNNLGIITLKYGRYRFTPQSIYKPLTWLPVYISRSRSGDAILTLYLAATESSVGSTSQQEALAFSNSGRYSSDYSCTAPSNSYGTSHMRAINLGNLYHDPYEVRNGNPVEREFFGEYAWYDDSHSSYVKLYNTGEVNESNCNKFSDFIYGTNFNGILAEDIATPAEMMWQESESSSAYLSGSYAAYNWPNEAYGIPSAGSYADPVFDYASTNKTYYDRWKNDKVWLPSLTEVGTGNNGLSVTDTTDGIWKLNNSQRSNKIESWLRSADTGTSGSFSTYSMYCTAKDGTITTMTVDKICGIRPAIHLNLSKISTKTVEPIKLPETVTTTYDGEVWTADRLPADQRKWYFADDMNISFFMDKDCTLPVAPINAGTYYMMVELKISSSRYFYGESKTTRLKSTQFVVEKCKLGVQWTYDTESEESLPPPIKVDIVGEFYERDKTAGNIPEIGMKYSNSSGAGIMDSVTFPDKIGYYTATAYIVDEDLHEYNYELAGRSLESEQFHVSQKKIPEPVFLENDSTTITKDYKGKQWIQIKNVSEKYVTISVEVSKTKGQTAADQAASASAAKEKIVDLGIVDDVQTFIIEDVGEYTFSVKLNDVINTVWENSGSDYSDKNLVMTVEQAYITVTFEGLDTSWASAVEKSFDINVLGIYSSGETVTLDVYYIPDNSPGSMVRVSNASGRYVIPAGRAQGNYSIYAMLSGTSQYTSNYRMKEAVYQKFTITATVASFDSTRANWQYKLGNSASATPAGTYNQHDTPANALELDFKNEYYVFSLGMSETQLQGYPCYVKATYSGDTYVKDAGLHSVTVTITAYDKNVEFTPQTYTIYFRINKAKFNMGGVQWDSTGVGAYSGKQQCVSIKSGTLPTGLTVVYETDGIATNGATNAGHYTTSVSFRLADGYATNYVLPVANDSESYEGTFDFEYEWDITKKDIHASWNAPTGSSPGFFIPTLTEGHSLVDYSFEKKVGDSWVACTSIGSTSSSENYKVTATIKSEYANNYTLSGTTYQVFTVAAGQYAVSLYFEIDGERSDPNAQVTYKASAFNVEPQVETGDVTISSFTVNYFKDAGGGAKGASVSNVTDAGKYVAEVVSTLSVSETAVTFTDTTLFPFEVIKADFDVSALQWRYAHGETEILASYNSDLGKWVDSNGKEVTFEFEFDATVHTLELVGYVQNLSWNPVTGNVGTNANDYTANVTFTYSTDNYNTPDFPTTLSWKIKKAKINFEQVKWGYIDSNGREHEFDFKKDSFMFTRTEGQEAPVKFRVGLINLPAGLSDLFKYYTTSYTDRNFGTKQDNAFSAIGEYHTWFEVNGSYNPGPNYETFNQNSVPANLSLSQDWSIVERPLTSPRYDNSWTVFDNKAHDLIALCNMPREELCYFSVEITFIDKANSISNDFTGYKNEDEGITEDYYAKHAGTYIVRFYELRGDNAEKYIWGTVEIDVNKEQLEVTWDLQGTVPVARVTGIYVSEMLQTKYTNTSGGEVTVAYIHTTNDVTFFAEPFITEEYAKNITFVMLNNQAEKYEFKSSQFNPSSSSAQINKDEIRLKEIALEYTGSAISFELVDWSKFSQYLYISDGKLTQTDIGKYSIRISFIKDADAYWAGTDGSREDVVLDFRVIKPTRQPLDYPKFDNKSLIYSGSPQTFTITNWIALKDYIYYVYKTDEYRDGDGRFTESAAKIYSVTFYFIEGGETQGYWKEDGSRSPYTVQFRIVDPNAQVSEISNPILSKTQAEWTGSELSFVITNWEELRDYVQVSCSDSSVSINGATVKATDQKTYELVFKITSDGVTFEDGSTEYKLKFTITPSSTRKNELSKPEFDEDKKDYTGEDITFEIKGWDDLYGKYDFLEISCSDENVKIEGGKITVKEIGEYTVTVTIKDGVNAKWKEEGITSYDLTFSVTDPDNPEPPEKGEKVPLAAPAFENSKREFTGYEITFALKNWDVISQYITVKEGSLTQTAIGTYTVTLQIDSSKATWADGSTDDVTLTFEITQATITLDADGDGVPDTDADGNPVGTNGDGEKVKLDEFLEPHYFDGEGNELSEKDLKDGEQYTVKYTIKDDEKFNSTFTNSEELRQSFTENTYNVTYRKPKGINWILIICIVAIVVLLILIIVTIVVIKKRRANDEYYDDYAEDYDDYDDYDEDDYDDYDDYDDEYYDEY